MVYRFRRRNISAKTIDFIELNINLFKITKILFIRANDFRLQCFAITIVII